MYLVMAGGERPSYVNVVRLTDFPPRRPRDGRLRTRICNSVVIRISIARLQTPLCPHVIRVIHRLLQHRPEMMNPASEKHVSIAVS